MSLRPIKRIVRSKPTLEGAGVHLRRAFGFGNTSDFDPFLLLDDFRNDIPQDYLAGFPWHPHRGIETITYVLAGTVEHGDSMGNQGAIAAGDVQWMTAGSGIIHQEMPKGDAAGRMHGFQLWANLPSALKMTSPRYQEVKAPTFRRSRTTTARGFALCAETSGGKPAPWTALPPSRSTLMCPCLRAGRRPCRWRPRAMLSPTSSPGGESFATRRGRSPCPPNRSDGLDTHPPTEADNRSLILFDRGDEVMVQAGEDGIRFLLVSGKPLEEPVAWYGPIVMNTQEQLREAFQELEEGTFLKDR